MESSFVFRQLKDYDHIDYDNLVKISELIYDTDPYIYPCIFRNKDDALRILPMVLQQRDDQMFRFNNFYIAEYEDTIIGLILWCKGPLDWDARSLHEQAVSAGVPLSPYLPIVQAQYFESYKDIPTDVISLINVCVDQQSRSRGVGNHLLQAFISEQDDEKMELYVLADNHPAKKVYDSNGFKTIRTIQGFSSDNRELPCLQMERS